jgi:UDP-glucose 4-epimerase
MRALVTGGAGFIGTNLVKRLLKDEHEVIVFDNYSTGFRKNQLDGCRYAYVDIREDFTNFSEKVDVIFHLAALPRIKPSFENPSETLEVNVNGTVNVLEYARKNNVPVVYAGSSSFHGGVYKNPYTFTKWQGEEVCKMYEEIYDLNVTICRFYNVYGDYMPEEGEYRTVLPIFLEQYKNGNQLTITGDGHQRRDFTHVDDIVDAIVKCFEQEKYGYTFELGRGENHSMREVARMFPNSSYGFIPKIPGEARHTLCESTLAMRELSWKPKLNLKDWIKEQV